MTTETCRHGVVVRVAMLDRLPPSQGGLGRHKCAACAYAQGQSEATQRTSTHGDMIGCAHGRVAPGSILRRLPGNQGGTGRHKCVVCAYQDGRASERGLASEAAWDPRRDGECHALLVVARPTTTSRNDYDIDPTRKKAIGDLGEELVLEYERSSLLRAQRPELANRVTHVAAVEGDAAGYDIRSYDSGGEVKYIEVKTTTTSPDAAFYITENERNFGNGHPENYHIYRLFELDEANQTARFFVVSGAPTNNLRLTPIAYRASIAADEEIT